MFTTLSKIVAEGQERGRFETPYMWEPVYRIIISIFHIISLVLTENSEQGRNKSIGCLLRKKKENVRERLEEINKWGRWKMNESKGEYKKKTAFVNTGVVVAVVRYVSIVLLCFHWHSMEICCDICNGEGA